MSERIRTQFTGYTLIILTALVGGLWIYVTRVPVSQTNAASQAAHVNFRAPSFDLTTLDGSRISLADMQGKVTLVSFWATWCVPCRSEMPAIQAAYEAHRGQAIAILAINAGEDDNSAAQFVNDFRLSFPILMDRDQAVLRAYQVQALPTSFFVDREGIIRATSIGGMSRAFIEAQFADLLTPAH